MASAPAAVSYETLAKAPDTYFKAVDAMDIEGVMACFADDATLTVQTDHVTFTGAAEIRRMFTDFFGASVSIGHEIRNIVVEPGARQGRHGAGVLRRAQGRLEERHAQLQLLRLRRGRQVHPRDHLDGGHEPAAVVEVSRSWPAGAPRSQASAAASTVASLRPENITPSRVVADGQPSQLNGRTVAVTRARYSGVSSSSTSGQVARQRGGDEHVVVQLALAAQRARRRPRPRAPGRSTAGSSKPGASLRCRSGEYSSRALGVEVAVGVRALGGEDRQRVLPRRQHRLLAVGARVLEPVHVRDRSRARRRAGRRGAARAAARRRAPRAPARTPPSSAPSARRGRRRARAGSSRRSARARGSA